MYDGNNALQKCMMEAMPFENVSWQQCPSKIQDGSNSLLKCMMTDKNLKVVENIRGATCISDAFIERNIT